MRLWIYTVTIVLTLQMRRVNLKSDLARPGYPDATSLALLLCLHCHHTLCLHNCKESFFKAPYEAQAFLMKAPGAHCLPNKSN